MTAETIPGTHYPECNDRCDGDSHYLLGDLEDDPAVQEEPVTQPKEL